MAIACARRSGSGIYNLEFCNDVACAKENLRHIARATDQTFGLKLQAAEKHFIEELAASFPEKLSTIILSPATPSELASIVDLLRPLGKSLLLECTSLHEGHIGAEIGMHGLIAKGQEAGGRVGHQNTFILLRHFLNTFSLPVYARGGIGLHTAAACHAAGAAGVVLDVQLALTRESPLPETLQRRVGKLEGRETTLIGESISRIFRVWSPDNSTLEALGKVERDLAGQEISEDARHRQWEAVLAQYVGKGELFLFGQDIGFARPLAENYVTVAGVVQAMERTILQNQALAASHPILAEHSPLARAHGTRYPLVQGPMARVSDTPAFAQAIVRGGALPFFAIAWLREKELDQLLRDTKHFLADSPWGVGLLGFLPADLYTEQQRVICRHKPPFAIIAGGKPNQVLELEQQGIATYVHVPSLGLLSLFLEKGATRFVFEGREAGGHVGPFSSFVLWENMIDHLFRHIAGKGGGQHYHLLFAGGISDEQSTAAIAAMTAPLAAQGVRIGLQLGSAYLFTEEAVTTGAILPRFQKEILQCGQTVLLESSPGHAVRCAKTAFTQTFEQERQRLLARGLPNSDIREALALLERGRLRIATKGLQVNPQYRRVAGAPRLIAAQEDEQTEQGEFMIGDLACLHHSATTIEQLHARVVEQGACLINRWARQTVLSGAGETAPQPSDIAIIGMSCFLPKAPDVTTYWSNIVNKVNAIREIPGERWDWRPFFSPDPRSVDKIYSKWGAFLDDIPFDPLRYGMPPNVLASVEPLHLLSLEAARLALDDAGYGRRPFCRDRTAVFMGISGSGDLGQAYGFRTMLPMFFGEQSSAITDHFSSRLPQWTEDSFPGILMNVAAGRIANRFDLGGANALVDAACASSLAALYLGIQELESGNSDMALVGSADCMQNPFTYMCFSKTRALSPRGVCNSLAENADGIVLGEGAVMLVLKRLKSAERDGDRIYAVIKGMGASSDGRDRSLTAPGIKGQVRAMQRAYAKSGISPTEIGLAEAHATGTAEGDKIELESLGTVYRQVGTSVYNCAIGSVKSMIGHTKSSAGLASLVKVALALHHKVLPPTLGIEQPNKALAEADSPFYPNIRTKPWIRSGVQQTRKAVVSAFGFGGANYHAVLEEYDNALPLTNDKPPASFQHWPSELFPWRGDSPESIITQIQALQSQLAAAPTLFLGDLSYTLHCAQGATTAAHGKMPWNLAIVANSREDLLHKMETAIDALKADTSGIADPRGIYCTGTPLAATGKVAFLFPGQGSQYVHMLADLAVQFPAIRELFERTDTLLAQQYPQPISTVVFPPDVFTQQSRKQQQRDLADTRIAQPALGTAELALWHLLCDCNVIPEMVAGHSYGEYVALCAAGVFSEEELIPLSAARARCIVEGTGKDSGTMAAVEADEQTLGKYIADFPEVWLANLNSPRQSVIAGTRKGVQQAMDRLAGYGIKSMAIPVSCAFHSPLMQSACDTFKQYLDPIAFAPPRFPVYANTTGRKHTSEGSAIKTSLVEHLVKQVRFADQIEAMYADGARLFLEVGPGSVLGALVRQVLGDRPHGAVSVNIAGRSGLEQLHHALAQLISHGVPVRLEALNRGRILRQLDLNDLQKERSASSLTPTTWLINGSSIRPFDKPRPPAGGEPFSFNQAAAPQPEPATHSLKVEKNGTVPPGNGSPPGYSRPGMTMEGFQAMMRQFLACQSNVMLQFLSGLPQTPSLKPTGQVAAAHPSTRGGEQVGAGGQVLPQFVLRPQYISAPQRLASLDAYKTILLTDDGRGIAVAVRNRLHALGYRTALLSSGTDFPSQENVFSVVQWDEPHLTSILRTIEQSLGPVGSVLHLLPLNTGTIRFKEMNGHQWQSRLQRDLQSLFFILQRNREQIRDTDQGASVILCATSMGGSFGWDTSSLPRDYFPGHGAFYGFAKTLSLEWPETRICTVNLCLDEPVEQLADALVTECFADDGVCQVGHVRGQRQTVALIPARETAPPAAFHRMDSSWVVLVTGGARGITANIAIDLARRYKPTFILAGRSPLPEPEESALTRELVHPPDIKRALIERYRNRHESFQLADIEKECSRLLNNRVMRESIAQMRAHGARVFYHQLDVRDEQGVKSCLDDIYAKFGRLDGIVHGAGIIEDKLFVEKQWSSFSRVIATKIDGAFFLSRYVQPESLRFFCFFASVAGSFGNIGQCDYAAGNEILNKLALSLDKQWPHVHVFALNWGPWAGGMASDEVQRQFQQRGVELIESADGVRTFHHALRCGTKGEVELVVGEGPWHCLARETFPHAPQVPRPLFPDLLQPLRFDGSLQCVKTIDPARDLYLQDHCLDGKPVLPATMAVELMAEAATIGRPGWVVQSIKNIKVYKGIVVDQGPKDLYLTVASPRFHGGQDRITCAVTLSEERKGRVHYSATVLLAAGRATSPVHRFPSPQQLDPWTIPIAQLYQQCLFHGPLFQCIDRIEGEKEREMVAMLKVSSPARCLAGEPQGAWTADPVILDGGLQMALIWARQRMGITVLPSSFEEVRVYRSLENASKVVCHMLVEEVVSSSGVIFSMYFSDVSGELYAVIDRIQATGSRELNRLAEPRQQQTAV